MSSVTKPLRMNSRIIVAHYYSQGSASSNRISAYAKGFQQEGREVFLILGCTSYDSLPMIEGVRVVRAQSDNRRNITRRMVEAIKACYIQGNSAILIYGTPVLCWFLPKSKYNIFYECTEVPFYGRNKTAKSLLKEGIKLFLSRRATGMFVISHALKRYFKNKGIKEIEIINMFVDSDRFDLPATNNKRENYVGYCGTISPYKDGVDILIQAYAQFRNTHKDYCLKLIGKFESKDAENYLKSLVRKLGISDSVCFTGIVAPDDMPDLLCEARMLALARPNNEQAKYGFPTKLGEYLATGNPVVVTDVGEIGFFLKDGFNCRMAKPGDVMDFAEKMNWIADHYEEALRMGGNGKELTRTDFSSRHQCKKALNFMDNHAIL